MAPTICAGRCCCTGINDRCSPVDRNGNGKVTLTAAARPQQPNQMLSTGAAGCVNTGDVAHHWRGASGEQVTTIGFDGSASVFMPPPPARIRSMMVPIQIRQLVVARVSPFHPFAITIGLPIMLDGDGDRSTLSYARQNAAEQHGLPFNSNGKASTGVSGDRIVVGLVAPSPLCRRWYSAGDWFCQLSTTPLTGETTRHHGALTSEQPVKAIAAQSTCSQPGHSPRNGAGRQFGDVERAAQVLITGAIASSGAQRSGGRLCSRAEAFAVTSNGRAVAAALATQARSSASCQPGTFVRLDRKDVRMAIVRCLVDDVDAAPLPFYAGARLHARRSLGPPFAIVERGDLQLWLSGPGALGRKADADGAQTGRAGGWNPRRPLGTTISTSH